MRDNIDIDILEELLSLGGLGIQYCIKSELAYSKLQEVKKDYCLLIIQSLEKNIISEIYQQDKECGNW